MFTGIITDLGRLVMVKSPSNSKRLKIACGYDGDSLAIGASICCSGVCLTVVERGRDGFSQNNHPKASEETADGSWFEADVSSETIKRTTIDAWREGRQINLERSLTLGAELGGHMVLGHVDGLTKLVGNSEQSGYKRLDFTAPDDIKRFIVVKGSVAIDGVSLTINDVVSDHFSVMVIPHTLNQTTLRELTIGDYANIEADMMARYGARLGQ